MQTDLTSPDVVKTFGNNLDICLRLIGSRPESLALRCNTNPQIISGFKQGLGVLSEQLVFAVCNDIGIPRELILKEYRSSAAAIQKFEKAFQAKGKLTASNLIGGDEVMKPQLELPPGKLNDHTWRQNFGQNVRICLQHMGMTALSLATRAAFKEDDVHQILVGKLSLSNDDIEAIRLEIGLNTNDLIMDYIDASRRDDELFKKLKSAGRIKQPQPATESEQEPDLLHTPEISAAEVEAEVMQEEPAIEPAIPATVIPAEAPETMGMETMTDTNTNTNTVTWKDDDITGKAGDRTFNLRDKEQRKIIGTQIKSLKDEKRPNDTWPDVLEKCGMPNKAANWVHGVSYGTAPITATEVESFAEFFGVTVWQMLTGESETVEAVVVEHDLEWSKDGVIATDKMNGRVFNLADGQLSREVARRALLLCPAETTIEQMLDECCIDETGTWFEAVKNGTRNFAEDHIEGLAEFLSVSEFVLLSGEGLDLPEESADEAGAPAPVVSLPESAVLQPEAAASAEEPPSGGDTADNHAAADTEPGQLALNLEEDDRRLAAFQEHFKQRLLSADFNLADDVSLRSFLAATQAPTVDWCDVYHTMTNEGVETLKQVAAIAERFDSGDDTLMRTSSPMSFLWRFDRSNTLPCAADPAVRPYFGGARLLFYLCTRRPQGRLFGDKISLDSTKRSLT